MILDLLTARKINFTAIYPCNDHLGFCDFHFLQRSVSFDPSFKEHVEGQVGDDGVAGGMPVQLLVKVFGSGEQSWDDPCRSFLSCA